MKTGGMAMRGTDEMISAQEEFLSRMDEACRQKVIGVRLEPTGPDPRRDMIGAIRLAWGDITLSLDCLSMLPAGLTPLRKALESPAVKVFHNAGTELQFLMAAGINPTKIFDTALAGQMLSESGHLYSELDELAGRYLPGESVTGKADILLRLRETMIRLLKRYRLVEVAKIEFDCAISVAQMEFHGIMLDVAAWRDLTAAAEIEKRQALEALRNFTGQRPTQTTLWGEAGFMEENFDSNAHILSLLRGHGIKVENTAKPALAAHRSHPLVAALSRYRAVAKQLSTYLRPLPKMLHPKTGRLHPQYSQIAAWTGRMSCYAPNIQQIPRGGDFRGCFVAPEGRRLLIADYPQIELRVVAQITRERRMIDAYARGLDLHSLTASLILGKTMESISGQERQYAKAVNFGLIYAMGAEGLRLSAQQSYGVAMTHEQAADFRRLFFEAYPAIRDWHTALARRRSPEGRTLTGRRYSFPKWYGLPAHSNAPVQGTAADILKRALGGLAVKLAGTDAFIAAAIHDEIIMECPQEEAEYYGAVLKREMEEAADSILPDVPTKVEVRIAGNWSEK